MRVTTNEIIDIFHGLMNNTRTREDASNWASAVRVADDAEGNEYVPRSAEKAIWDALEFLMGFDMKDSPNSYLYSQTDLEKYWTENNGKLTT
jgi:hypothetical protein